MLAISITIFFSISLMLHLCKLNKQTRNINNIANRISHPSVSANSNYFKRLKKRMKKQKRKRFKLLISTGSITITFIIFATVNAGYYHSKDIHIYYETFSNTNKAASSPTSNTDTETSWCTIDQEYFTIWERLLNNDLLFSYYKEKVDGLSQQSIETFYQNLIANCNNFSEVDFEQLAEDIEYFISIGILPEPTETIYELNSAISSYEDPMLVPIELYQKELIVRVRRQKKYPSKTNLYQAARASDDILEILRRSKLCSYEDLLLYPALAVDLYTLSLSYDSTENKSKDSYMNYRSAVLFIAIFSETSNMNEPIELKSIQEHALLSSYSFLNYGIQHNDESITQLPDVEYYMAYTLYFLISKYSYSEHFYEECAKYASAYLKSSDAKEKYTKSCRDILEYLIDRKPELATYRAE
ncbi:MAG: hypothetical protein IJN92_08595 [Lachnospiraceae bacterium]|nr:hypothetical protein [Lachnospiraceae bacterium]